MSGASKPSAASFARTGGISVDDGFETVLAEELTALTQRVDMAVYTLDRFQGRPLRRQQVVVHPKKPLPDNMQAGVRHNPVNVGNATGNGILDRNHAEAGFA